MDYVVSQVQDSGWVAGNKHDRLKHEAIHTGPYWEADKMTVYAELKACCLDSKGLVWIKQFESNEDRRLAMVSIKEHYEGAGGVNKRVAWVSDAVTDSHYKSEQTFSFEKFLAMTHDDSPKREWGNPL